MSGFTRRGCDFILAVNCFIVWFVYRVLRRQNRGTDFARARRKRPPPGSLGAKTPRVNAEASQRCTGFFQRKTDDTAARTNDARNAGAPGSLGGIGPGFIERVLAGQIFLDHPVAKLFENDAGQNSEILRPATTEVSDEDGRSYDVSLTAEKAESARSFRAIGWFADDAPVELDQGIGGQKRRG